MSSEKLQEIADEILGMSKYAHVLSAVQEAYDLGRADLQGKLAEAQEKARLDLIAWCNSETERVEAEDARDRYAREANKLEAEVERLRLSLLDANPAEPGREMNP